PRVAVAEQEHQSSFGNERCTRFGGLFDDRQIPFPNPSQKFHRPVEIRHRSIHATTTYIMSFGRQSCCSASTLVAHRSKQPAWIRPAPSSRRAASKRRHLSKNSARPCSRWRGI